MATATRIGYKIIKSLEGTRGIVLLAFSRNFFLGEAQKEFQKNNLREISDDEVSLLSKTLDKHAFPAIICLRFGCASVPVIENDGDEREIYGRKITCGQKEVFSPSYLYAAKK